jgi:hypothetical protein
MTASVLDEQLETAGQAPYFGKLVLLECDGVRHLAKQDEDGKWRTVSRKKELRGYIVIVKVVR